jgi:hypothetical protein
MGASGVKERAAAGTAAAARAPAGAAAGVHFDSAAELREILDSLLREADADPEIGPRLRSAKVPLRLSFPDLGVVLDLGPTEDPDHHVRWSFAQDIDWEPALTLEMGSDQVNRYLQGRLNLVIAIAHREVKLRATDPRAALAFLPLGGSLCPSYRRLVERRFPHLALA